MTGTFFKVNCPFEFQPPRLDDDTPNASCWAWLLSDFTRNLRDKNPVDGEWLEQLAIETLYARSEKEVLKRRIWGVSGGR